MKLPADKTSALLICWLLLINAVTFIMYGADKLLAKRKKRRIPERTLIGAAAIGGSIGALAGMYLFRHKTLHRKFTIGVPAILAAQCLMAAAAYLMLRK